MGRTTRKKQEQAAQAEAAIAARLTQDARARALAPPPPSLLDSFQRYAPFFVRDPNDFALKTRSSRQDRQALEWARWLFGRYRVPRILDQVWAAYLDDTPLPPARFERHPHPRRPQVVRRTRNPNLDRFDFRAWYICLATGGSLYKDHAKGVFSKRECHAFLSAPTHLDLCQAVVYAVATGAGASVGDALRLACSRLAERPFEAFWFDAVRFFCLPGHRPANIRQIDDLLDYFAHRQQEDAGFRVLGASHTLDGLLRRMEQWHRALARARDLSGLTWPGVALPDWEFRQRDPQRDNQHVVWRFHQITTGKELAAEGSAMRHCVYGYKARCVNGACSIWSLTRTDEFGTPARRMTIELAREGNIVQKRGLANRAPRSEEEAVVARWAREFNLSNQGRW